MKNLKYRIERLEIHKIIEKKSYAGVGSEIYGKLFFNGYVPLENLYRFITRITQWRKL